MTVEMLRTHPTAGNAASGLAEALAALAECGQVCTLCADACLAEEMVADLRACIRLNLDCADLCVATARVLARHAGDQGTAVAAQLEACRRACQSCAEECEKHATMHEHCRVCAEVCRRCEQACQQLIAALA